MKSLSTFILFILCFFSSGLLFSQMPVSITEARELNPDGTLENDGLSVELSGIAIGPNFRPEGLTFVLFDTIDNIGITVFDFGQDTGYEVQDGDELTVSGELTQFNGLAEIVPSTIELNSEGNGIPDPEIVQTLNELSESKLIRFENAHLVDPDEWQMSGSFNVRMANNGDTIEVRIDSDVNISGMPAPVGMFNITGIGSQFDPNSPFDSGYQLLPRSVNDINPYNTGEKEYTFMSLEDAREVEQDGSLRREGECVSLTGIVHGINYRPQGLQFTIINEDNTGIGVFSSSDQFGYTVTEGDKITLEGVLSQFSGLAQINPDTVILNSQGNDLVTPEEVEVLNESTESALVQIDAMSFVNEDDWLGDGSSYNVEVITTNDDTLTLRIDSDTDLSTSSVPPLPAMIIGIGGQFDSSPPYDSGYQLFPRYMSDIMPYLATRDIYSGRVSIYPNPVMDKLWIETEDDFERMYLYSPDGRLLMSEGSADSYNLSGMPPGVYLLILEWEENIYGKQVQIVK